MTLAPTAGNDVPSALSSPSIPSSVAAAAPPTSSVASAPAVRGQPASAAPKGPGGGSGRWLLMLVAVAGLVVLAGLLGLELPPFCQHLPGVTAKWTRRLPGRFVTVSSWLFALDVTRAPVVVAQ